MTPASPQRRRTLQALASLAGLALGSGPHRIGHTQEGGRDFWRLLREGGCVVLMRHAQTVPGVGDPPGWRLGQCSSQRNLSEAGREQARRVGAAFQREGVRVDEVRSSAWCRCTDTADLAFGRHTVWEPLNSFFQSGGGSQQIQALRTALPQWPGPGNLVLVTHQVNMSSLTGEYPSMGELFLTRPHPQAREPWRVLARTVP
jgi:phosphohistidine phosphatase SixA